MSPSALIIEDDPGWFRVLNVECARAGVVSAWARSSEEAIDQIDDSGIDYRLVVLDLELGDDIAASFLYSLGRWLAQLVDGGAQLCVVSGTETRDAASQLLADFGLSCVAAFEKAQFSRREFGDNVLRPLFHGRVGELSIAERHSLQDALGEVRLLTGPQDAGREFERFCESVLTSLPVFRCVDRNVRNKTSEIDLVLEVVRVPGALACEWSQLVLVECRFRKSVVGSRDVAAFADQLATRRISHGLMISAAGFSGQRGAIGRVHESYAGSGLVILPIPLDTLERAIAEDRNLHDYLRDLERAVLLGSL